MAAGVKGAARGAGKAVELQSHVVSVHYIRSDKVQHSAAR